MPGHPSPGLINKILDPMEFLVYIFLLVSDSYIHFVKMVINLIMWKWKG